MSGKGKGGRGKKSTKSNKAPKVKKTTKKKAPNSKKPTKTAAAKKVGALIAKICKDKGVAKVVFDRNGYLYHGRISALAQAAREGGLEF